jgi:hypothetical protein
METAKNITTDVARGKTIFCMQNHTIRREKTSNANSGHRGRIRALPSGRGCVVDQPQQLRKTNLLKYA